MIECNEDCLNCVFEQCKYDKPPKEKGRKKKAPANDVKNEKEKQYQREYYQQNKERLDASHQKYRETHREKVNALRRASYWRNREKELARRKEKWLKDVFKTQSGAPVSPGVNDPATR